jgi:hypothetical protein
MRYKIAKEEFSELRDSQKFGAPRPGNRTHEGIDLCLSNHKEFDLYAWKSGIVQKRTYNDLAGYSTWLIHNDGTKSMYVHLTEKSYNKLKNKQVIGSGEYVARAGRTGNATTNLCHYEYYKDKPINPLPYIIDLNIMSANADLQYFKNYAIWARKGDEGNKVWYSYVNIETGEYQDMQTVKNANGNDIETDRDVKLMLGDSELFLGVEGATDKRLFLYRWVEDTKTFNSISINK